MLESINGIKIKNIKAATLYEYNRGIRNRYEYTDGVFNNSLFSIYLNNNGLNTYKGVSTRDIICLDFDYGTKSYQEDLERITNSINEEKDEQTKSFLLGIKQQIISNKGKYNKLSKDELRTELYKNGISINYELKDKNGNIKCSETINYTMLYRTSAKAKLGQVMFINDKLYEKAYDWLTIGLGNKMPMDNARIVEMSAYAPLTTSTIIDTLYIPIDDIVILEDQDSLFKTIANVVKAQDYADKSGTPKKKCIVSNEETTVKNTMWDGMALIEENEIHDYINGMALLRNHLFKACAFKSKLQKFFFDWCFEHNLDYNTFQIKDMFGRYHYVKDIKMITTENAIKWKKFINIMGGTPEKAYDYWKSRIESDGCIFGIVKTDHPSKLGDVQQMSYQMINTLPSKYEDIKEISRYSVEYVELMKKDNDIFEQYLRKNANDVNHYEMMADLYNHNHNFSNSEWFRSEKRKIINSYVNRLRKGKITINADNLTVCGNPYALLLYSVGEDYEKDPMFHSEDDCIQCYTSRFNNNEYLCAFRSPHNSPNNICYLHNIYNELFDKYFSFSDNIIIINMIHTDIQDRANGMDEDSDFMFVTNQSNCVQCAKICYTTYPTIVNKLKESGITYMNTKVAYASMDNKFSKSKIGIGESSNLAQNAMSYYWHNLMIDGDLNERQAYYNNFVILSVLAQVIIDGCKREYEIDAIKEIKRIKNEVYMRNRKLPEFARYTREIKCVENGKELEYEEIQSRRKTLDNKLENGIICPMNWLEDILNKIQNSSRTSCIPTYKFFIKMNGNADSRQISKIRKLVEEYDNFVKENYITNKYNDEEYTIILKEKLDMILDKMSSMKIKNKVTVNRLIETALGLKISIKPSKNNDMKYSRKILNLLYKTDKETFLSNFIQN